MADKSDEREYRVKLDNAGDSRADIKGIDVDPGREIKTSKSADLAKQDMEFGEAMESDMNKFSRDLVRDRTIDKGWKDRARRDGNKNLETSNDLTFIDKMYTPAVRSMDNPERGDMDSKINANVETGEDNAYFNSGKDKRTIEKSKGRSIDKNRK